MRIRTLAVAMAATVALAGCGGGTGSGGEPPDRLAAGIQSRIDDGFGFRVAFEDIGTLGDRVPPMFATADGLASGALRADDETGAFAFNLGPGDGLLSILFSDDTLYLRADVEGLQDAGDAMGEPFPLPEQGDIDELGEFLPPDLAAAATAFLSGGWVGITGLDQQALDSLSSLGGVDLPDETEAEDQAERLAEIAETHGLGSVESVIERFVVVEGEGPTYELVIRARDLATAIDAFARDAEAEGIAPDAVAGLEGDEAPDLEETPEELRGVSVTLDGSTLETVHLRLAAIHESLGTTGPDADVGSAQVGISLDGVGNALQAPGDAVTVDFATIGMLVGMFFGGMMDGFGEPPPA